MEGRTRRDRGWRRQEKEGGSLSTDAKSGAGSACLSWKAAKEASMLLEDNFKYSESRKCTPDEYTSNGFAGGRGANKSTSERQKGTSARLRQGISTEGWLRQNNFSARPYLGSGQKKWNKNERSQISRNSFNRSTPID